MPNSGIATEIYSLINNEEVRPTTNLVISKCSAYDYLNNSIPNLEKLTTQYYETFSITGRFTGYFSHITIGDFFNTLSAKFCEPTAILGGLNATARKEEAEKSGTGARSSEGSSGGSSDSSGSSGSSGKSDSSSSETSNGAGSSELSKVPNVITNPEDLTAGNSSVTGKRGTENFGIAVFDKDVLCGELTAVESMCHLLITNELDSCIVSIDNPVSKKESEKMELHLFPSKKSEVKVDIKDNKPYISIKLSLEADIMTLDKGVNYETDEVLSKISYATKEYMKEQLNEYLNKVSKEYNVDIDHFCTKGPAHFSTIYEWEKFNWEEKFKAAVFDVNIDIDVLSTMLITKT